MSLAEPLNPNMLPSSAQAPDWLGPISSSADNFVSILKSDVKVNSTLSMRSMYEDELQRRDDEVFKLTGKRLGVHMANPKFGNQYGPFQSQKAQMDDIASQYPSQVGSAKIRTGFDKATQIEAEIEELRKQYPEIKSRKDIFEAVSARRAAIEGDAAEITGRASTVGTIAGFAGGVVGSFSLNSPETLATLPLGGFGKKVVTRLGTEALTQMAIAGVQQAKISKDYASMGEVLSPEQQIQNVLFAGAGGAVFRGAAEAAGPAASKARSFINQKLAERAQTKDAAGNLAEELINAETPEHSAAIMERAEPEAVAAINDIVNPVQSTAQRGAVAAAEVENFTDKLNPFENTATTNARQMHETMLQSVNDAIESGQPLPTPANAMPSLVNDIYKNVDVERFDVEALTIDAPAMQFKSGGDEAGVTDRLKGTKAWSDYLAGVITVWKKEDGTVVVADGHQRVGFAKRLMAENADNKISIPAFVFKESDGDTQAFVRAAAALRNISEGSGSPLDAAAVFRDMPSRAKAVFDSLPPNSQVVKQGLDLASLDNEAYLMVRNGVVDEKIGAVVGRLEKDLERQRALMALMANEEPDTIFQAEQIVKQAQQAGFATSEQSTLFGSESVTESLFKDKAKVLERGLNLIKSDVKTFRNLMTNSQRIAEAGNALNSEANQAILQDANAILHLVQKLAYSKGPIADLLTQSAKEAKQNGRYKQGAERFVAALRERLDEGGLSGVLDAAEGDISNTLAEVAGRIESEGIANNIAQTSEALTAQPKTIEETFNQLKMVRDIQEAPAERISSTEAGKAPSSKPMLASSAETQLDAVLSQRMARKPSADFSTANIAPETLTGGKAKLGIRDNSNNAIVYHAVNDKATLMKKAEGYEKPVAEFISDVLSDVKGAEFIGSRVKALKDVENKLDMLGRRADQVSDYLGARIQVDSIAAAREAQEKLGQAARVIEVDDFLETPRKDSDYHAVHMQLMTKDGFTYEVQIIPRDLMDVYEKARPSYADFKEYRGKVPEEKAEAYIKAKQEGNQIFKEAWQKFQERDLVQKQIAEFNMNDEVPVGIEFDTMGNETIKTAKLGDLMKDIEAHESLLKNMTECLI